MNATTFDTLAAADALRAAGLEDAPSRAIVNTVREAVGDQVATKTDLAALKADLEARLAGAVNRMLLAQLAIAGLLFAALKLF